MCAMHANQFIVLAGSTRPTRRSPVIAQWVAELGNGLEDASFRTIDLRDLGLGLDDEPAIPARNQYVRATTRAWSDMVANARGVVFVSPQYNWGYPAALKNAIDHLYREWAGKPGLIVTYGGHGGGKCAAQLREILFGLDLKLTEAMPGLRLARERIEADDGEIDPERDFEPHRQELREALRQLIVLASAEAANAKS
jgi:NAD(P)H-dependent FMN reductase